MRRFFSFVIMPDFLMVDDYLYLSDYWQCAVGSLRWPWSETETHFVLMKKCPLCKLNASERAPRHIKLDMNDRTVIRVLVSKCNYFFCKKCKLALYDHYTPDECIVCE